MKKLKKILPIIFVFVVFWGFLVSSPTNRFEGTFISENERLIFEFHSNGRIRVYDYYGDGDFVLFSGTYNYNVLKEIYVVRVYEGSVDYLFRLQFDDETLIVVDSNVAGTTGIRLVKQ